MAPSLDGLPDELFLQICTYLKPERLLSRTLSTGWYDQGLPVSDSYAALSALCLTSKRLNQIATSQLYANIITHVPPLSPDIPGSMWKCIRRLFKLMKVIAGAPSLGLYVQYIEHRFSSYGDSDFEEKQAFLEKTRLSDLRTTIEKAASSAWPPELLRIWNEIYDKDIEQAHILFLLALTPNVARVFVDIYEPAILDIASLLRGINSTAELQNSHVCHFERLETVGYFSSDNHYFEDSDDDDDEPPTKIVRHPWASILQSLQCFPNLRYFQHAQYEGHYMTDYNAINHLQSQIQNLRTLKLLHCNLTIDVVATLLRACRSLKHFALWLDNNGYHGYSRLYPALLEHQATLEVIDIRMELHYPSESLSKKSIGSFSGFTKLRQLRIPDMILMGVPDDHIEGLLSGYNWTTFQPVRPLIDLLPASIEGMVLSGVVAKLGDETDFLWDFIANLDRVPRLREFGTGVAVTNHRERLIEVMAERGVRTIKNFDWNG